MIFSYQTNCESPAGDQFWKFSSQCSIFGRTGDHWVAISSPVYSEHRLDKLANGTGIEI